MRAFGVYHWLLAEIALGLEEIEAAKAEAQTALGLAERLRSTFQDPGKRIAWQGRLAQLCDLAVYHRSQVIMLEMYFISRADMLGYSLLV